MTKRTPEARAKARSLFIQVNQYTAWGINPEEALHGGINDVWPLDKDSFKADLFAKIIEKANGKDWTEANIAACIEDA